MDSIPSENVKKPKVFSFHGVWISKKSSTIAGAQLGGRGGRAPLPFFENRKKVPWFWKKGPNYVSTWFESCIQNVVSRGKVFPCGDFFFCFWQNVYQSALTPQNLYCPKRHLVACLHRYLSGLYIRLCTTPNFFTPFCDAVDLFSISNCGISFLIVIYNNLEASIFLKNSTVFKN